jgi:formamidopyrimidine-DNA glycosylase
VPRVPELPEVEVVRADLAAEVVGRTITAVRATGARTIRRAPSARVFSASLRGARVEAVARRGKYLLVGLDRGRTLVVHLRMSGQLLLAEPSDPVARHTHVVLGLDDGRQLRFVDPRTFGELFVVDTAGLAAVASLARLGPEPSDVEVDDFVAALAARRARIKSALMDQRVVAGVGNIYSDEALHRVGLRGDARCCDVPAERLAALHGAVVAVLGEAVAHRGSSLGDDQYVDLHGRPGGFRPHHRVYGRPGLPCPACGTVVVREVIGGRSAHRCPSCQP